MKGEIYKRQVVTRDESLARILGVAVRIKKGENQLWWKIRDLRTRLAKLFEVDGGIFEHL
jgi:hypothetical protein